MTIRRTRSTGPRFGGGPLRVRACHRTETPGGYDSGAVRARLRHPPLTWLLLVVSAAVLMVSGCQVKTDVALKMDEDGSGTVTVTVTLDKEAAAKAPDLAQQLKTDDLTKAGWKVAGPTPTSDGGQVITATKRFADAADAGRVVRELSGRDGPFSGFSASREHSFGQTSYRVDGTLDLSEGLNAFADADVTALLGGLPYGRTEEQLTEAAGGDLAAAAPFTFTVELPNGGGRVYRAQLGDEPITIASRSDDRNVLPFVLVGVAVLLVIVAVWVFIDARRRPDRRLRRPSERGTGGYVRRPYQVYDEVDESLPAGVGGPPVEITVRRPGEEPEPAPPAAPTAEATETSSRRRRRADAAVAASAATTVSRRAGPRQITVRRPTRPDVATRRQALADPTPRKVTRPRSVRPRGPR